jgi:polycystin 2
MVGLINYHFSNGMLSLFIDTPSSTTDMTKTFRNQFVEEGDLWDFLLGGNRDVNGNRDGNSPFLNGLYFDTWYDGTNTSSINSGYIFYQNKLLGPPRIMQVRVKDNSCTLGSSAKKIMTDCASSYYDWAMSKDTWGYGLTAATSDITYSALVILEKNNYIFFLSF